MGTGGTIAEAELVKEDRLEVWSDGRLKRLLEDTERYFPRDMRAHSVACGKAGVRALADSGGWALIKRSRFVNLTKTDAGEESWARYLRLSTVSTLTCGPASLCLIMSLEKGSKADGFVVRGCKGWWRAFCRPMSDQQYLSAMSFPLDISHPGRLSGAGLTVTQARGLYGQGVDHDSVLLLLMKIGELLRAKGVVLDGSALRWFDLFSGAGIMASVAWEAAIKMDMTFSYEACCDRSEKAVRGHKAAWVGMEPKIALSEVCDGGNEAKMAGLAPGCWCAVSGKCAPVSSASTTHGPGTAAKQEELENFSGGVGHGGQTGHEGEAGCACLRDCGELDKSPGDVGAIPASFGAPQAWNTTGHTKSSVQSGYWRTQRLGAAYLWLLSQRYRQVWYRQRI